jgi:hypothetical protein
MNELTQNDLRYVVQRLPRDIRTLLSQHPKKLFVGGGFIRATIAGETPSDIDLFGPDKAFLESVATILHGCREGSKVHKTKNASTLLTQDRLPVQFITRWTFRNGHDLVASFDFTVCQAAIWRSGSAENAAWHSRVGEGFYIDLAGRRLVYTNPVREEEAGGSMLRVIKYVKRGYSIQVSSLGDVIARLADKVDPERIHHPNLKTGGIIAGLLREVDPLLVVDGLDVVDDHEDEPQAQEEAA